MKIKVVKIKMQNLILYCFANHCGKEFFKKETASKGSPLEITPKNQMKTLLYKTHNTNLQLIDN